MLKRAVLALLLLVAGAPMLADAETALLGTLLVVVGLSVVALPFYLRRSRPRRADGVR